MAPAASAGVAPPPVALEGDVRFEALTPPPQRPPPLWAGAEGERRRPATGGAAAAGASELLGRWLSLARQRSRVLAARIPAEGFPLRADALLGGGGAANGTAKRDPRPITIVGFPEHM